MKPFLFILFLMFIRPTSAQTLNIHVSGIRNTSGSIRIQFFDTKKHFDDEQPLFTKTAPKAGASKGLLNIRYANIPAGTYGIAILDDENNNQKMDYGLILPVEGFGFSDYYHKGMTRPDFDKFKFTLGTGTSKEIQIVVRYL